MNRALTHSLSAVAMRKAGLVVMAIISMALSACVMSDSCLDPGSGLSYTETVIVVPASNKKWINSNVKIDANTEVPLLIEGNINLCSDENENIKQLLVHGNTCADGSAITYPTNYPFTINCTYIDCNQLCPGVGLRYDVIDKIDTGIKARTGDTLRVDIVPYKIVITDCDHLPPGVYMDEGHYDLDASGSKKISVAEICKTGGDVYINGTLTTMPKFLGTEFTLMVADVLSPEGNKYFLGYVTNGPGQTDRQYWYVSAMVDLRLRDAVTDISGFDCTKTIDDPVNVRYKKVASTLINEKCNRLCIERDTSSEGFGTGCVGTYHMPSTTKTLVYGTGDTSISVDVKVPTMGPDGQIVYYAQSLDLYVSDDINGNNRSGYTVKYNVPLANDILVTGPDNGDRAKVLLHYYDPNNTDNFGGYHVKVKRTCKKFGGDRLYLYVGSSDPNSMGIVPGESGTFHIGDRSSYDGMYTVNKDTATTGLAGTIYFVVESSEPSSGEYKVTVKQKDPPKIISVFFNWLMSNISDVFRGEVQDDGTREGGVMRSLYESLLIPDIRNFISVLISLYIALSSMGYITGIVHVSPKDVLTRLIKLSIILMLFSENSWQFFTTWFLDIFLYSSEQLSSVFSGRMGVGSNFEFLDDTLGVLLNEANLKRMASFLLAGPIGWAYFVLIIFAFWEILCAMVSAMLLYIMAFIAVSLLVSLFVVFLSCFLFEVTKQFFDQYIKVLCVFVMQPVFAFVAVGLMNDLLRLQIYMAFNFGVCDECLISFYLGSDIGTFCIVKWFVPMGYSSNLYYEERLANEIYRDETHGEHFFGLPVSLSIMLQLYALAMSARVYLQLAIMMPEGIFNTMFLGTKDTVARAADQLKSIVGQDQESKQRRDGARRRKTPQSDKGGKSSGGSDSAPRERGVSDNTNRDVVRPKDGANAPATQDLIRPRGAGATDGDTIRASSAATTGVPNPDSLPNGGSAPGGAAGGSITQGTTTATTPYKSGGSYGSDSGSSQTSTSEADSLRPSSRVLDGDGGGDSARPAERPGLQDSGSGRGGSSNDSSDSEA